MAGRPPKPARLKLLHGNPGQRKVQREPKPAPKVPGMPTWLSAEAKAEWRRVVPQLDAVGTLAMVDRATLTTYCVAWATLVEVNKHIQEHGATVMVLEQTFETEEGITNIYVSAKRNPSVQTQREMAGIIRSFAAEFGLTPASRSRISVPARTDDDIAELLRPPSRRSSDA